MAAQEAVLVAQVEPAVFAPVAVLQEPEVLLAELGVQDLLAAQEVPEEQVVLGPQDPLVVLEAPAVLVLVALVQVFAQEAVVLVEVLEEVLLQQLAT